MERTAYVLALVWGCIWALTLQFTPIGKFLAVKRTWLTVVVGVGVDLLIALIAVPSRVWRRVALIIAASALGIVARSLINEWVEMGEMLHDQDEGTKQDAVGSV